MEVKIGAFIKQSTLKYSIEVSQELTQTPKGTANCMIYGELGRFELASTIEKRMVNFWARVCQGKASKLSNIMYRLLRQLNGHTDYKSKWITKVENILVKCGMRNIWLSPESVSRDWLKRSIECKVQDLDIEKWRSEVERTVCAQTINCTKIMLVWNVIFQS